MEKASEGGRGVQGHMKAAVYSRPGPPDVVVEIKGVEKPAIWKKDMLGEKGNNLLNH
jgi:hypothetical protein